MLTTLYSPQVLVTGATGFIGRHLCTLLVQRGYRVIGAYRRTPPTDLPAAIIWRKIDDIGGATDWASLLSDVDYVIHLAGMAHQFDRHRNRTLETFTRINTFGTRQLVDAMKQSPCVKRLVYVSSVGAVKSFSEQVITDATICEPDTAYGKSKRAAELVIEEALADSEIDWCILRPPLVYGPGNPGNMARLVKLVERGLPLPLAAIHNRRSFLFVGNLTDVLERCLVHPNVSRRTFLVSDGYSISTPDLLRALSVHTKKPVHLFALPTCCLAICGRLGDLCSRLSGVLIGLDSYSIARLTSSLYVDSTPLQKALNWRPSFTLAQGVAITFNKQTLLDQWTEQPLEVLV